MARRTARQIAASRRNIVKAQRRSAELRRRGAGKNGSASFYGKGRKGRKAAKLATYGRRRDGLSVSQRHRRAQRSARRSAKIGVVLTGAAIAASVYGSNTNVQKSVNKTARRAKNTVKGHKMVYDFNRVTGSSRAKSAKATAQFAGRYAKEARKRRSR